MLYNCYFVNFCLKQSTIFAVNLWIFLSFQTIFVFQEPAWSLKARHNFWFLKMYLVVIKVWFSVRWFLLSTVGQFFSCIVNLWWNKYILTSTSLLAEIYIGSSKTYNWKHKLIAKEVTNIVLFPHVFCFIAWILAASLFNQL